MTTLNGSKAWCRPKKSKVAGPTADGVIAMANHRTNTVAVFIPTDDSNWRHLAVNVADIKRQRDMEAQIVVLDRTHSGIGHINFNTISKSNWSRNS